MRAAFFFALSLGALGAQAWLSQPAVAAERLHVQARCGHFAAAGRKLSCAGTLGGAAAYRPRSFARAGSPQGGSSSPRHASTRRAHILLGDVGSDDDDLSKEFSELTFKMPRIIDQQRASYEAWRERRAKETKNIRKSNVVSSEEVDLDDPQIEPKPFQPAASEQVVTPIDFDMDLGAYGKGEEEDAYVVDDIDAEDNDATDNYLNSL